MKLTKRMLKDAQYRALRDGVPFALDWWDIVIPTECPVLGIKLKRSAGRAADCSPSLDRVKPDGGYIPGNVEVISHRANTLKSNATPDEMLKLAIYYNPNLKFLRN